MISRSASHALRALLVLAEEPGQWRSMPELADAAALPGPSLEQLLLKLRRAGVVEARRGRNGGYRLARAAADVSLAAVLAALGGGEAEGGEAAAGEAQGEPPPEEAPTAEVEASLRVTEALRRRLQQALQRELQRQTLEDLHHDLRSSRAALREEGGLLLG